jgi:hypothetical protein
MNEREIRSLAATLRRESNLWKNNPERAQRLRDAAIILDPHAEVRVLRREATKRENRRAAA